MEAEYFLSLVNGQRGHFLYESGYHSDTWLDLETICSRPDAIRPAILELSKEIAKWKPEVICGPLIEGGFIGLLTAIKLGVSFVYAVRHANAPDSRLFPISYELPAAVKPVVCGKRVVVVNDVISAGSAVRGSLESLKQCGANVVGISCFAVLGEIFCKYAEQEAIPFNALLKMPNNMWEPEICPLCAAKIALQRLATH